MIHKKYNKAPYWDRDSRNQFIAKEFENFIGNSVLNVGGGGMLFLKKYLPNDTNYFEMDIAGTPDIKINLEKELPIPKETSTYDTVICTDVLEHLDNAHEVLKDLVRISNKYIILSLPNPTETLFSSLLHTKFKNSGKFYGLPSIKPEDRHKWFYTASEANDFFESQAENLGLQIKEIFDIGYYGYSFKGKSLRNIIALLLGNKARENLTVNAIWVVYEKGNK